MNTTLLIAVLGAAAAAAPGCRWTPQTGPVDNASPVTWLSAAGETFDARFDTDGTVEVRFMPAGGDYLKTFLAAPVRAASGARYQSADGRFVFWTKGEQAVIRAGDGTELVAGTKTALRPYDGAPGGREIIYFDPHDRRWHDPQGLCHACTPAHGFGADGQIDGTLPVVWQEAVFALTNDLGEPPPVDEVRELFETHYSANPAWYGTQVSRRGGAYRVVVATEDGAVDFLAPRGALRAWYTAAPAQWPK